MRRVCLGSLVLLAILILGCDNNENHPRAGVAGLLSAVILGYDPPLITCQTLVFFTAYGMDPEGRAVAIVSTRWDWDNDRHYDTGYLTGASADHVFPKLGAQTVRVEAVDADGRCVTATTVLTVTPTANPLAVLATVEPYEGTTTTNFKFRITLLEDLARDQLVKQGSMRWDWENDGHYDTPFIEFAIDEYPPENSKDPVIYHRYSRPGAYTARVQAKSYWNPRVAETTVEVLVH